MAFVDVLEFNLYDITYIICIHWKFLHLLEKHSTFTLCSVACLTYVLMRFTGYYVGREAWFWMRSPLYLNHGSQTQTMSRTTDRWKDCVPLHTSWFGSLTEEMTTVADYICCTSDKTIYSFFYLFLYWWGDKVSLAYFILKVLFDTGKNIKLEKTSLYADKWRKKMGNTPRVIT